MKRIALTVSLSLFLLFTGFLHAQTTVAVLTESGRFKLADLAVTPPVNVLTPDELTTAVSLQVLEDGRILSLKGSAVKSFKMTVVRKSGSVTLESDSEKITPAMTAELRQLATGNKVIFENINAGLPDGTTVKKGNLEFMIQ
jgi:hypothetical protein